MKKTMSFVNYIKETRAELAHVSWPTQNQTIAFTAIVIAVSVGVAALLGLFDGIFAWALEQLISRGGI